MHTLDRPQTAQDVGTHLRDEGWAVVPAALLQSWAELDAATSERLHASWNRLAADHYLRDGGHYRRRRHSCHVVDVDAATVRTGPRRAHWQSLSYNALHGGIERWFEPVEDSIQQTPAWHALMLSLGTLFARVRPVSHWYVEAHQFRVDTTGGIGRPTPEGAHRDGVDFVAVLMLERHLIKGGETRVFEADGPQGVRFTLLEPWSALLLDDWRVIHESTPIQPLSGDALGWRDTLVLTFRQGGYQEPPALKPAA